jgi:Saxitoxin biosynthesis operon protein SxtJ
MQWADVVRKPSGRHLRQFAGLWLVVFLAMAGWRAVQGRPDTTAAVIAGLAVLVGVAGLLAPALVRPIYAGWMVAAFPIGWTVSRLALAFIFFVIFAPLAWVFRRTGRDALHRRRPGGTTLWVEKIQPESAREYLRQS